jgi:hypothetical protein
MPQMQVPYDMQKAWDARIRKFYGSRYDYKRNAVHTFLHQYCHLQHVHRALKLLLVNPVQMAVCPSNCNMCMKEPCEL